MERQYIGARYVPMFANPVEWDNQRTFEALTIVTYMGASYTSKKRVPAGVLPTNGEYWVVTGNYNAQVEEYRQAVVNYGNEVTALKENFNNKTGRDIIFLGDSYGANPRVANSWCSVCAEAMRLPANKWHNLCVSGASFGVPNAGHYIDQLAGYTGNRNSITDIVLFGGTNDIGSSRQTILDAGAELMTYIKANYPNAKAYVGYNSLTTANSTVIGAYNAFETYNSLGYCGFCVIPNMISFNHDYATLEDGSAHPDLTANNVMGWALASFLGGGELFYPYGMYKGCTFETVEGFTITGSSCITEIDHASATIRVNIGRVIATVDEPTEWTSDSHHVIGKFVCDYMKTGGRIPSAPIQFGYLEDGVWKSTYATIIFNNDGTVSVNTLGEFTPDAIVFSGTLTIHLINC